MVDICYFGGMCFKISLYFFEVVIVDIFQIVNFVGMVIVVMGFSYGVIFFGYLINVVFWGFWFVFYVSLCLYFYELLFKLIMNLGMGY